MPGFVLHNSANDRPDPVAFPLAASQTYANMDPVFLSAGEQLTVSVTDGTEVLIGELIGFAAQAAAGEQSATRTGLAFGTTVNPGLGGATADAMRSVYPATPALLIRTQNFYTDATGATQAVKSGADRGKIFQIASDSVADNVAQWGVVDVSATEATDAAAHVVDVLDDNLVPVAAGTSLTAGEGWIVFRIVGTNQWTGTATIQDQS
jgi:hypothetical protein